MTSRTTAILTAESKAPSRAGSRFAIAFLAFFGVGLIYGVGFAAPEVLHNAAHDARHANGFPCH